MTPSKGSGRRINPLGERENVVGRALDGCIVCECVTSSLEYINRTTYGFHATCRMPHATYYMPAVWYFQSCRLLAVGRWLLLLHSVVVCSCLKACYVCVCIYICTYIVHSLYEHTFMHFHVYIL